MKLILLFLLFILISEISFGYSIGTIITSNVITEVSVEPSPYEREEICGEQPSPDIIDRTVKKPQF